MRHKIVVEQGAADTAVAISEGVKVLEPGVKVCAGFECIRTTLAGYLVNYIGQVGFHIL